MRWSVDGAKKSGNIIIDYVTERTHAYLYIIFYIRVFIMYNYFNILYCSVYIRYYCVHAREAFDEKSLPSCFQ